MTSIRGRVRITESLLKALSTKPASFVLCDAEQKGFQVKGYPSGHMVYQVEARLGGTGANKKFKLANYADIPLLEARERARGALDFIRQGIDPLQQKRKRTHEGMSLKDLIDDYLSKRALKPRTVQDYRYFASHQFRPWLNRRVSDITSHEVLDWYHRGASSPTHTEGGFRFLNSLMRYAIALEVISQNPCEKVTLSGMRYRIKRRKTHVEVNTDLSKFITALATKPYQRDSEKVARDCILLILITGLRSQEARAIQWKHVDFERRCFTIPDPKNHEDHTIPFTLLINSIFRFRWENRTKSPYVFRLLNDKKSPYVTNFQKTLNNICTLAKVPRVTPHDVRRTFATLLNSEDVGYADLKMLMNHKSKDITAGVYIQPDINKLRVILNKLCWRLDLMFPFFLVENGYSPYAKDTLSSYIYGRGNPIPSPVSEADHYRNDPTAIILEEMDFFDERIGEFKSN
ncbi:MAG: hypothetical protein JWO78_1961 [Micavibrio sp.]|nr:hypothetical protein [Micavibrio sp.]